MGSLGRNLSDERGKKGYCEMEIHNIVKGRIQEISEVKGDGKTM